MVKLRHIAGIERFDGLTNEEAARRLKREGYNELPTEEKRTIITIALEVLQEPMFLLLLASGVIYLLLGDKEEALMLIAFVFVVIGITIYQERRVEHALKALQSLSSPRALVIRGGEAKRIPGREVVRGDVIIVVEGDRVPADAILLSSTNLLVDESLLTGESVPVRKSSGEKSVELGRPGGDDLPFVYSSTLVVSGYGIAEVKETGVKTEIGKIGKVLQTLEPEEMPLRKETEKLVRMFAVGGLIVCTLVVLLYALTRGSWLHGLLAGITLAMALLPEEIPVVLMIFFALGAWRMSQRHVLTRKVQAIQTLGSTTVLCVDKTGTITFNRMSVKKIFARGKSLNIDDATQVIPEDFHELVEFSILASQHHPFDPMEKALKELGKKRLANTEHLHGDWELLQEYPLSRKLLALSNVWESPDGMDYVIATKGAPEAIFDLCHMDKRRINEIEGFVQEMAGEGLRVLGVARASFTKTKLPSDHHDFDLEFLGLIGFQDPVRPQVAGAVKECYDAGIRVIITTGDYPVTARNIAKQIGLASHDEIITGPSLEKMSDEELQRRLKTTNIFARLVPEQKLRIVNALKANGEVVAMTGDGVNDAPALKSAHIGIAMGGRGSEVAREASSLVLLDDDFSSIVQTVKAGRRIFDNLKKAMAYIFAIHVPIAGMSLLPVLFRWPLALFPAHIAFLELIIDPVCSVVFEAEPEEKDVMRRPPRRVSEPLFARKTILLSIMQGLVVLLIVSAMFKVSLTVGKSENQARALAFITLVIANMSLILTNRSWSRTIWDMARTQNKALIWVSLGALVFLGLALYVPALSSIFKFGELRLADIVICVVAGLMSIAWFELLKISNRNRIKLV